jgi:peptidoglycan/xylan/chitin deacetylase (PgdA/CDA1 family)
MLQKPKISRLASRNGDTKVVRLVRNAIVLAVAFFCKVSFQRETVVLVYHSISPVNNFHDVDPIQFSRQIEYLKRNYRIVSLDDIVSFIRNTKNLPRKAVAITFDDAYHNCYLNVYPYFRKNKFPVTIFVAAGYVGKKWPWNPASSRILSWDEIEEMSKNAVEFGAHTVTHSDLEKASLDEATDEIQRSKTEIEEHIGKNVKYFSYPFGKCTTEIVNLVRACGFEGAVGGIGTIHKSTRPFLLNRVQIDSSISSMLFKARLTKAVDWWTRLELMAKKILGKPTNL